MSPLWDSLKSVSQNGGASAIQRSIIEIWDELFKRVRANRPTGSQEMNVIGSKALKLCAAVVIAVVLLVKVDTDIALFAYDKLFATSSKFQSKFEGKRVWITGASSGIGADLAEQVASHGGNVVLSGRRKDKLEALATRLKAKFHVKIQVVSFDLRGESSVISSAVVEVINAGSVDILILNAGVLYEMSALDTPISTTSEIIKVNYEAPVQIATELMREDRWTEKKNQMHIVVVSSTCGAMTSPFLASYSASKHALNGYFLTLGIETSDQIRIGIVMPGPVRTELHQNTLAKEGGAFYENIPFSMSSKRCARLILSSMLGPDSQFFEVWIGSTLPLLYMYICHYFPVTGRVAALVLGKVHSMFREDKLRLW